MKYLVFLINVLIISEACLAQENVKYNNIAEPQSRPHQITLDLISRGLTKFALELDRAVTQKDSRTSDNFVVAPACLQISLAMILLASKGKTFDEVSRVLGFDQTTDISQHSEMFHHILSGSIKDYQTKQSHNSTLPLVKFASGIFVENGFSLLDQYKSASKQLYDSEVRQVDFSRNGQQVKEFVNNWVRSKTLNKIKEALPSPPDQNTVALLLSTLYFKGLWMERFEDVFGRRLFKVEQNESVEIEMVKHTSYYPYNSNEELGFKIVGIPYKGSDTLMYIILPGAPGKSGLAKLKERLTAEIIEETLKRMEDKKLRVYLPKMTISRRQSLKDALISLGLSSLFSPNHADLSLLSSVGKKESTPPVETRGFQDLSNEQPSTPKPNNSKTTKKPQITTGSNKSTTPFQIIVPDEPVYNENNPIQTPDEPEIYPEDEPTNVVVYDDAISSHFEVHGPKSNIYQQIRKPATQEFFGARYKRDESSYPNLGIDDLRNHDELQNVGLYLSNLHHAVEISVDELGTEAAASATGTVEFRSAQPERFDVIQPFLFFIRQTSTKSILFWGSINKPTPNYPPGSWKMPKLFP
ncbi:hypothetical protein QAD02_018301 [Eretmocerus hayati]|uniref:Uncharacterized protein n=1 Tax=Eretmocerus hayati TaxID=131215 RepID=A0ACC2PG11_9HYME|nr:hypothetical protein QAD02_018301 [Eretmocerus hayati]